MPVVMRGTLVHKSDVQKAPAVWTDKKVTETLHDYLMAQVVENFEVMERIWWPKKEQFLRWWKMYRGFLTPRIDPDDWRTNLFIPMAFSLVETWEPRLILAYFENENLTEVTASRPEDEPFEKSVEAELNFQFHQRMKIMQPMIGISKWSAIIGHGIGKVWFDRVVEKQKRAERVTVINPFTGEAFSVATEKKVRSTVTFEGLRLECCDPFGTYWNPNSTIDKSDFVYEQQYMTEGYVRRKMTSGQYANKELGAAQINAERDPYRTARLQLISGTFAGHASGQGGGFQAGIEDMITAMHRTHEIIEAHAELEWGMPGKWRRGLVTIANRQVVLNAQYYPIDSGRFQFVSMPFHPQPNDPFPIGMIEPIEHVQNLLNDYHSLGLDSIKLILNRMFVVDPTGFEDDEEFQTRPGAVWNKMPGRDSSQVISALDTPDVPQSFWSEMSFLNDLVQRVSGVSDYFAGLNTASQQRLTPTKGGMEIMMQQAASRFNLNAKIVENVFFDNLAQISLELLQEYKQEPTNVREVREGQVNWRSIHPEDILGEFAFTFRSNLESVNKSGERDDLVFLFREFMNSMQIDGGGSVDIDAFRRVIAEKFDLPGLERIFTAANPGVGNPMDAADPMKAMGGGTGLPPNQLQMTQAMNAMGPGGGQGGAPPRSRG